MRSEVSDSLIVKFVILQSNRIFADFFFFVFFFCIFCIFSRLPIFYEFSASLNLLFVTMSHDSDTCD